ncbi:hypothetical protein [Dyella sp. 2YAF14]|uniref:hypothetical protein n=1 Tax=Dyella sp. 2YAF14 TaxID=3233025 RepID=UPI003F8EE5EF
MIEYHSPSLRMSVQVTNQNSTLSVVGLFSELLGSGALDPHYVVGAKDVLASWQASLAPVGGELHLRRLDGNVSGLEIVATARQSVRFERPVAMATNERFDSWEGPQGSAAFIRLGDLGQSLDRRFGAIQHTYRNESFCGDSWTFAINEKAVAVALLDGLGHGPLAASAVAVGIEAFLRDPFCAPALAAHNLHTQMGPTIGGVGALAHFDRSSKVLTFAGVGDVSGRIVGSAGSRGLVSVPGILGRREPKFREFRYSGAEGLLALHSDGLHERWNILDYPGLQFRHPAVIAAILHRDFARLTDDGTLVILDLAAFTGG